MAQSSKPVARRWARPVHPRSVRTLKSSSLHHRVPVPDRVTGPADTAALSDRLRRWGPVFLAAVVVRLAYWAIVLPGWTPVSDADQYDKIARSLANGTGYGLQFPQIVHHPTAFRPPLLPLLLTPGHWLFDGALWPGRLLSVVLGSAVVVLAGVLAARIGGRRAGYVAALVVMFSPPLLANDTITLTEPLALLLGLAAILLLDEGRFLQAGLATGLLLLTRPNGYQEKATWETQSFRAAAENAVATIAKEFDAWGVRLHKRVRSGSPANEIIKAAKQYDAGLVVVAACVLAPWLVRNRVQLGTWTVNTSDGFTLAAIYAPQSQAAGTFTDPVLSPAFNSDEEVRLSQFNEGEWNALLTDRAVAGLRTNPGYVPTHPLRHHGAGAGRPGQVLAGPPSGGDRCDRRPVRGAVAAVGGAAAPARAVRSGVLHRRGPVARLGRRSAPTRR